MSSGTSEPLSALGRQVSDIIEAGTEWPELARKLDIAKYERDDRYQGDHRAADFQPMFLAYLYALVEDESLTGMAEVLESNEELAAAMGFDPDDLPSKSTFLPQRLDKRFSELGASLNTASKEITQLAREAGSPIGNPVTNIDLEPEDDDVSERTLDRLTNSKSNDFLDQLLENGFFSFELPQAENSIYDQEDLLALETIAALNGQAANDAGKEMSKTKNPNSDAFDDPFYLDGPSGETLLESIKQLSVDEIADNINETLEKTYQRAKPKLDQLDKAVNIRLAIDVTYVAYYGDRGLEWVSGAPDNKGYDWCHKFATATIVGENTHFVVAVEPLGSPDYVDNAAYPGNIERNYRPGAIVRRLLDRANDYVNIRVMYADREFYTADVIAALEKRELYYVIPAPARKRLKRKISRFDELKNGFADDDRDEQLYVQQDYAIRSNVKGNPGDTTVYTNLVILPPDEESERDGPQPFISNLDVDDEIRVDRVQTAEKIQRYDYRGGIETSYKSIKQCAAWTTSKEFEVRWFHFAFGCMIYNMWLLVDLLTQASIGQIKTRTKPRITLQRFLNSLDQQLSKRIKIE